ncbi:MFS transporter [Paludibacterium paludis]|uniref:MFS transporter n=1 Tax=Paludibacterium paludis TaxID=1225769 RepID=A0A918P6D3_9NEIS|nr:MFS transporter [Paludibacterium paludis]GGY25400.1 MFS transporter [Paludibacterium paludis]
MALIDSSPSSFRQTGGGWRVPAIMALAALEFVQNGMLNFASSYVMGGVRGGPEEFSFAAMAYAVCALVALFHHRWCVDRWGPRRFVQASLAVFALGGAGCALAETPAAFIAARALQGLGGAAFFTAARVQINRLEGRTKLLALLCFGYALLLGSALGPLMGGALIESLGWRWIFWGMAPWIATGVLASCAMPEAPDGRADPGYRPGAFAWLLGMLFLLQFAIQQTPYEFFGEPGIPGTSLILAALFLGGFLLLRGPAGGAVWQRLGTARYLTGLLFYGLFYALMAANNYVMPVMVQQVMGFDVPTTGVLLSVGFFSGMVFATIYARILFATSSLGIRLPMVAACLFLALSAQLLTRETPVSTIGRLAAILLLNGGFLALFVISVAQGTFLGIGEDAFTQAYQTKNMVRQVALSAAVALSTVFLQARNALHYARLTEGFSWGNPAFGESMQRLAEAGLGRNQALGELSREVTRQAMMLSCQDFFRMESLVCLALMGVIAAQKTLR